MLASRTLCKIQNASHDSKTEDYCLAPTGAQGVTISFRVCVCGTNLSRAVNLHLSTESNQRALRQHSQSNNMKEQVIIMPKEGLK